MKSTAEVGVDDLPPVSLVMFEELTHRHVCMIGYHNIESSGNRRDLIDQAADRVWIVHIRGHGDATEFISEGGKCGRLDAIVDDYGGTVSREPSGMGGPHTLSRSGDQCNSADE